MLNRRLVCSVLGLPLIIPTALTGVACTGT